MNERPIWLDDERELLALLHVVLDRFDRQSGESRRKAIVLPLDRHLPSLAHADAGRPANDCDGNPERHER